MKILLIAIGFLTAAGCASTGTVTSRPAIQSYVGKKMFLANRAVVVEGKNGVKRIEELKEGLISGDRVIARLEVGDTVEIVDAIYRSRPLQLRYFLKVRLRENGHEVIAECEIGRDGRSSLMKE
jgi:hypothetical protein